MHVQKYTTNTASQAEMVVLGLTVPWRNQTNMDCRKWMGLGRNCLQVLFQRLKKCCMGIQPIESATSHNGRQNVNIVIAKRATHASDDFIPQSFSNGAMWCNILMNLYWNIDLHWNTVIQDCGMQDCIIILGNWLAMICYIWFDTCHEDLGLHFRRPVYKLSWMYTSKQICRL